MEKDTAELEKLLPGDQTLRRSTSNRFQVSRLDTTIADDSDDGIDILDPTNKNNIIRVNSEPPTEREKTMVERKPSATGRFMVSTNEAGSSDPSLEQQNEDVDTRDESSDEPAPIVKTKGVKFSVGEKEKEAEELKREPSNDMYNTFNMKSWRNMKTLEHPPIMDFYRNSVDHDGMVVRPSMIQLIHGGTSMGEDEQAFEDFKLHNTELFEGKMGDEERKAKIEKFDPPQQQARVKFGWVQGVFVRCLLNIFGVMLYLRLSWVSGQAGIVLGSAIVLLASFVTFITALSTCAICTNGDVKGGGAYFLISRSLGPEFGGSIGLIFCVANAVAAAMYVVGFSEAVVSIFKDMNIGIIDNGDIWDMRVIGVVTCIILMMIVFIGTGFESKMQMFLLFILVASIIDFVIGSVMPINDEMGKRGATGYSWRTLSDNLMPQFRNESFFSVFAVYFPAATGIMAGANISGDLADPQKAIPIGTILAIAVTTVTYVFVVFMTGATCVRDADGINFPEWINNTFIPPACSLNGTCSYGLMNYSQVMQMESLWGPLILAGVFAATLSSALASLVSAPKVFQAVCKDRLFPKIGYFAKAYGKDEEPRRAYGLAFIIAFSMVCIGDLNYIAPIISNFFLASYALINYACFDQSFSDSPGFRPSFKYYNMWVSLFGSLLCIFVMFIIDWLTALLTFFCFAALFLYILHRKPDVNWGSSTQAHSYKNALSGMIKLSNTEEHVKNYRPQFLVLTGNPAARPSLVDFVNNITKGSSLMICGYVVPYNPSDRVYNVIRKLDRQLNDWLKKKKVKSFYASVANSSLRTGSQSLYQVTGLGKLRPNIVIMGFKSNWYKSGPTTEKLEEISDYFGTIQDSFDANMGVCVLRNGDDGLDFSEAMKDLNIGRNLNLPLVKQSSVKTHSLDTSRPPVTSDTNNTMKVEETDTKETKADVVEDKEETTSTNSLTENFPFDLEEGEDEENDEDTNDKDEDIEKGGQPHLTEADLTRTHHTFSLRRRSSRRPTMQQKELIFNITRFQRKIKKGTIDVWWLYDDGGLTLLLPHLLTIPKSYLEGARLRVFTISTSTQTMEQEQRGMAALLSKFRIDFSDVSVIADIGRKPKAETMKEWEKLITPFIASDGDCPSGMTTPSELASQREKTYRQLRAAELLKEHSSDADLIVMTLPVPRKGLISACLYLSWLDMMTRSPIPTLLIRGNQGSVLTFYS